MSGEGVALPMTWAPRFAFQLRRRLRVAKTCGVWPPPSEAFTKLRISYRPRSEGNAFFAEELLSGWLEAGVLARRGTGWAVSLAPDQALPPTIVGAVRQRVARLAPDVIDHLRVAAVVGRTFHAHLRARRPRSQLWAFLADALGGEPEPVRRMRRKSM